MIGCSKSFETKDLDSETNGTNMLKKNTTPEKS